MPAVNKQNDNTTFSDPNFAVNKVRAIHRWVPWIAGFSSEFVRNVLEENLARKSVVLDPFAGVGTTLVEAALLGHDIVGFEINPYAALACRVKLSFQHLDSSELQKLSTKLSEFYNEKTQNGYIPNSAPPDNFKTRVSFYSPKILRKVLIVQDFINNISSKLFAEVFQLAFAATMVSYSNYSYEPSLGTRKAVGKSDIEDYDVIRSLSTKLNDIITDLQNINHYSIFSSQIINDSFFRSEKYLEKGSVDICVTSPPYLNNYHYIRNTRPQLYWLGLVNSPNDTKSLEQDNFGKYWQTVRELEEIPFAFPNPPQELVEQLRFLRSLKVERGIYGGAGWANYAVSYFNDCYRFAENLKKVLRISGKAFVVIGNSILQGTMIPTDRYFGEIAEIAGLKLIDIHIPRSTRVGNSIIQSDVRVEKAQDNHQLYESVVYLMN
jgi:DNA modification methylase